MSPSRSVPITPQTSSGGRWPAAVGSYRGDEHDPAEHLAVAELARRAKKAGHLRPDFVLDDLIVMLMANDGIHATSPAARVAASRRFAALAIQAFQASPPSAAASGS